MSQLRALLRLRWQMVRSTRARTGLLALLGVFGLLLLQGVAGGLLWPRGSRLTDLLLLTPTLLLVFVALTVIAPLVAGGGNELFPESQLVAFPVRPSAVFAGSLVLAPLNLAWLTQLVALMTATAAISERSPLVVLSLLTTVVFVAATTVVGQALGWLVIGARQRPAGRRTSRAVGLGLGVGVLTVLATGHTTALLDRSPTRYVVIGAIAGSQGRWGRWGTTTAVLVGLGALGTVAGARACAWAIRRTSHAGRPEVAPMARRAARGSALAQLVATDRASVWRSTPLRRGCLVLALLPGGVAMLAHPTWTSLTLLPGLVAAGAGLLFGVNAFCLDGSGAVWVASLPHPPSQTIVAKLVVVGQTALAAVLLAVGLAVTQVRTVPRAADVVAVLGSVLGSTLLVVASCARTSVSRPHRADLRGPRDTPAPPAAMVVYSLRLALGTTGAGLAFAAAGGSGSLAATLAAAVAVLGLAWRSLLRTLTTWSDPVRRATVVTTVSYG